MTTQDDDRRALLEWLAKHDDPCPICAYALRGVPEAKCPECGAQLRLSVASPNASTGAWALAVVSFSLALGFDGVVLFMGGVAALIDLITNGISWSGDAPQILLFASPLIVLALASATGLWWFFTRRRTWALLSRRRQWRLAVLVFLLVGAAHCVGGLTMIWIGNNF
jgi:hypothetical protein